MAEILLHSSPPSPEPALSGGVRTWREAPVTVVLATGTAAAEHDIDEADDGLCVLLGHVNGGKAATVRAAYRQGGPAAVAALDGHFVVLLHDRVTGHTSVVRDKAGFGHVYYWIGRDEWAVSTSLPWLVRHARQVGGLTPRPSARGLALYLTYQYVPTPDTVVRDVSQLAPGSALSHPPTGPVRVSELVRFPGSGGGTDPRWQPTPAAIRAIGDQIMDLIREEAAERLAAAARVGMTISGGIDTSTNAIVLVERLGIEPTGFTASFHEAFYDESHYAQLVAEHLGIPRFSVPITPDRIDALPEMVRCFDTPNADQAAFAEFLLGDVVRREGCDRLVTGEGGDEVLGLPQSNADDIDFTRLPDDPTELARFYLSRTHLASESLRGSLFARLGVDEDLALEPLSTLYEAYQDRAPAERLLFGQWRTWLIDGVYMKDSRICRAFGIVPVFPLMGTVLMRYVADLPLEAKLAGLADKRFLRSVIGERLPAEVMSRTKHKFWLPTADWLAGPAHGFLRDHLVSGRLTSSFLERTLLSRLLDEHAHGRADHSRLLWGLLVLELWWARHVEP